MSAEKPLFLKELDRVYETAFDEGGPPSGGGASSGPAPRGIGGNWRSRAPAAAPGPSPSPPAAPEPAYVRYDGANTILLDNHLEKFERNEVGTCVVVPTWTSDMADDRALAPDSDLVKALDAIFGDGAAGAAVRVKAFARDHLWARGRPAFARGGDILVEGNFDEKEARSLAAAPSRAPLC